MLLKSCELEHLPLTGHRLLRIPPNDEDQASRHEATHTT